MLVLNQLPSLKIFAVMLISLLFIFACQENQDPLSVSDQEQMEDAENCVRGNFPPGHFFRQTAKFAVFSDPHLYDPALGISGEAFQMYLAQDRKMLAESQAILEAMVEEIINSDVQYVIIPGDLTKDGEQQCHYLMAEYLAQIEETGKQVFVVPGNHDIDNPHSFSYSGADMNPVPSISSSEFEMIYAEYGYDEAIHRDEHSLSYIVEPQPGLWFLGLDGCNYEVRFPDLTLTDGRIAPETIQWLKKKLIFAKRKRINVVAFMHHGVIEHFPEMESVFPEYLIDGWIDFSQYLMKRGVRMVFTGHHHANDISVIDNGIKKLYDIQTGSIVTWPSPYRIVHFNLRTRTVNIDTRVIEDINYDLGGMDFQTYGQYFLASGLPAIVVGYLQLLGVPEPLAIQLEPLVTPTLMAYYHGDEPDMTNPEIMAGIMQLINSGDPTATNFGYLLLGIWTDESLDNDVILELRRSMPWAKNH